MLAKDGAAVVRRHFGDELGGCKLDLLNELVAPGYADQRPRPGSSSG